MKATCDAAVRKRPVNLTLNEDLVLQARALTDNLSGVVESLLADYVAHESQQRRARIMELEATVAGWSCLSCARRCSARSPTPDPGFKIENIQVVLHPLEIVSVANEQLGEYVGSLGADGSRIMDALDELPTRARG